MIDAVVTTLKSVSILQEGMKTCLYKSITQLKHHKRADLVPTEEYPQLSMAHDINTCKYILIISISSRGRVLMSQKSKFRSE